MFFQEECGDNNFTSVGRRKRAAVDVENDANMAEATFSLSFKDDRKSAQGMYIYTGWGLLCVLTGVGGKTRKILKGTSTQGRAYWVCWRVWVGRQDEHSGYVYIYKNTQGTQGGLTGCVGGCGCGWVETRQEEHSGYVHLHRVGPTGGALLTVHFGPAGLWAGVDEKKRKTIGAGTVCMGLAE